MFVTTVARSGVDLEDSLKALRKAHEGEEAIKVYDAFRSHTAIHRKNRLLLTLLDDIRQANAEVGPGCGEGGVFLRTRSHDAHVRV